MIPALLDLSTAGALLAGALAVVAIGLWATR